MTDANNHLNPTLWRTCRVLANRRRLHIISGLLERPWRCVEDMAVAVGVSPATASQYLRALNARGLLSARRAGRYVYYSLSADRSVPHTIRLVHGLKRAFSDYQKPVEIIFRCATAFTHDRRVRIVRVLRKKPLDSGHLAVRASIPERSLARHLRKLVDRGFVEFGDGSYRCSNCLDRFGQLFLDLACEE